MSRTAVVISHALASLAGAVLYFLFVLPRWWELTGRISLPVGTGLRIATGLVIAAAAVPIVIHLLRSRRPEYGTPQLALQLKTGSIAGHMLAGALIIVAAISEIWLSLDNFGQWLFAVYGAAAAIAVLGIAAFYLSLVAELPPPPPKPLKPAEPKTAKRWRRGKGAEAEVESEVKAEVESESEVEAEVEVEVDTTDAEAETTESPKAEAKTDEAEAKTKTAEAEATETAETEIAEAEAAETTEATETPPATEAATEAAPTGGLRNRRPSGKGSRKRRTDAD